MNRIEARELAVRLVFDISARECDPNEVLSEFFDREYYDSLSGEDELFAQYPDDVQKDYIISVVRGVGEHSAELDGYVEKYARGWKFARISRTALAAMKTAMYEVMYMPEVPPKAAINAAVELVKAYDTPETVSFVNGVLGSFVRGEMAE